MTNPVFKNTGLVIKTLGIALNQISFARDHLGIVSNEIYIRLSHSVTLSSTTKLPLIISQICCHGCQDLVCSPNHCALVSFDSWFLDQTVASLTSTSTAVLNCTFSSYVTFPCTSRSRLIRIVLDT